MNKVEIDRIYRKTPTNNRPNRAALDERARAIPQTGLRIDQQ